jgi:hypothetical protein
VREETQYHAYTCVYCGEQITQFPCKGMPDGRRAHLECWLDHADEEEIELGR